MNMFTRIARAFGPEMNPADRMRIILAWGFIFGAVSHVAWVIVHGDFWYHGPGPDWAPWFWYGLCLVDLGVFWLLVTRPKAGVVAGVLTMIVSLYVNWTQFPTFEFQFNWILIGLTLFGIIMALSAPWLWVASRWRLTPSSAHTAD